MKCSRCGHRTTNINSMRKHYLKAHPRVMSNRSKKGKSKSSRYCPTCGKAR